jgi:FlaA1/EpsC-like NDP-sugar epimerase
MAPSFHVHWWIAGLTHLAAFAAAFELAILARFELQVPEWLAVAFWPTLLWFIVIKTLLFAGTGQFKAWWGHVSFRDLVALTNVSFWSLLCLATANHLGLLPIFVPRIVLLSDFAATLLFVGAMRSVWRSMAEFALPRFANRSYRPALLVGASSADKILALSLQLHPDLPFRIRGFLEQTPCWPGQSFGGVPVLGRVDQLVAVAKQRMANDVIAIAGSLPGNELRRLRADCQLANLVLHVLPPLNQLVSSHKLLNVKPLEIESLLQRDPVQLDEKTVRAVVTDNVVLVTGAGGSIGSEICRQLLSFNPRKLVIVDRSEPSLFTIDRELREFAGSTHVATCLGDITDEARMRSIFIKHRPQNVFHVAAHKHVPMLETHVGEAIKNNVLGTATLVDLAQSFEVSRFVYISTDKAVNPSSIMGASKRIAENYVLATSSQSSTRYVVVRFGNVLGSAGSVVPIFYEQIRQGGPITITHPRVQRFFMTIAEASQLVLQASAVGLGGEIFVLDMGEPILIVDLAKQMIRNAGLPEHAIDIAFVGMRPGEKLSEELYFADEQQMKTPHPKLFSARHCAHSVNEMREHLQELKSLVDGCEQQLTRKLQEMVPEYSSPQHTPSDRGRESESPLISPATTR